mmetsp:Transcript_12402/g.12449  ORF Transcript_12402/g.12449 Transcript_12402/m.12449 type:complete len:571 (+) Transcript_12402:119-1831(+)
MCGPTVYTNSHMGHARTYVSFDIIRRILSNYFGYDVTLCMNITDIDDKIIIESNNQQVNFAEYARKWEKSFFEDMARLNVSPPDVLTRVSEFVPDIVSFIEKLISNGFAYESNGSVYFDTEIYKQTHTYGKLINQSDINSELMQEGEGKLTDVKAKEKRREEDFALWKKSKELEPSWESPWGPGRPGWHIECSVMAADSLPCPIDIHSGGVDLRFPHHENELAQSEAFYGCQQWVNYFLHTGHLHIKKCKMSRSLKNFITINEMLEDYTPRQMRMVYLLHKWDGMMNYDPENSSTMEEAVIIEKQFKEFFMNIQAAKRELKIESKQKFDQREKNLFAALQQTRENVHNALLDNFGTDVAVLELSGLVNKTNVYMQSEPKLILLANVSDYVKKILDCFGLDYNVADSGDSSFEPLMNVLTRFRDGVRQASREGDVKAILQLCDLIRDDDLPPLGIKLEDRSNQPSIWKKGNPEELILEIRRKKEEEEKARVRKQEMAKKKEEKKAAQDAQANIDPKEMFRSETDKYSQWDDNGIPLCDQTGNPISKSLRKKLEKLWEKQKKLYEQREVKQE